MQLCNSLLRGEARLEADGPLALKPLRFVAVASGNQGTLRADQHEVEKAYEKITYCSLRGRRFGGM
jgi:hypothetical protein